jgi:N-acetylated-alpha-linked acidic dipeptidase
MGHVAQGIWLALLLASSLLSAQSAPSRSTVFGYRNFQAEQKIETKFLAVPSAQLAGEHLKKLSAEPHMAGTPADRTTAEYVAGKFREAGLETEIVPYRVLLSRPTELRVQAWNSAGRLLLDGPTPEHVEGDAAADNSGIAAPFNASSASGDVTGEVVYANYGRVEDFARLAAAHIDLHGKIVLVRYGSNFRGIKVRLAEQRGAAGVLIYSDPADDGQSKGDAWPLGPWRPDTAVQRGSVQYLSQYPGDPETPGRASTLDLPDSARISAVQSVDQPGIISIPISAHDAAPILAAMNGPLAPETWQGSMAVRYRLGPGGARVRLLLRQDNQRRVIWDVIGKVRGSTYPDEWVIAGNHRDAWVYGTVDPVSGTAAMLEAVHGIGALLRQGWKPRRTLLFCSWDAEEEGLIGSTEWVEQNARQMEHAVAYFNVDIAVSGPNFYAAAVPSLGQFVRDVTRSISSPVGGSVYQLWTNDPGRQQSHQAVNVPAGADEGVRIGALGSGSDFTPFLEHVGVPSADIGSEGSYGVYHSAFDDYAWYVQNADPHFLYLQQMARVFGLQALRMADADVLPLDYVAYARAIQSYLQAARRKASGAKMSGLDFDASDSAAARFASAARCAWSLQSAPSGNQTALDQALRQTESAFLTDAGLPGRPWYRHLIYAPGKTTGYAAVVLPGVNEAIDAGDAQLASRQLTLVTQALDRAANTLNRAAGAKTPCPAAP